MTMIAFSVRPDHAEIVTDTLSYAANGRSLGRTDKIHLLGHLDAVMMAQGSGHFGTLWDYKLGFYSQDVTDFDGLDEIAQERLPEVWSLVNGQHPAVTDSIIFHVGWSPAHQRFKAYAYASIAGFASTDVTDHFYAMPAPTSCDPVAPPTSTSGSPSPSGCARSGHLPPCGTGRSSSEATSSTPASRSAPSPAAGSTASTTPATSSPRWSKGPSTRSASSAPARAAATRRWSPATGSPPTACAPAAPGVRRLLPGRRPHASGARREGRPQRPVPLRERHQGQAVLRSRQHHRQLRRPTAKCTTISRRRLRCPGRARDEGQRPLRDVPARVTRVDHPRWRQLAITDVNRRDLDDETPGKLIDA